MPTFNTTTEKITLIGHNDDEIEAYFAGPSEPGNYPGVVVIHQLPGWDAWTREVTRKFADAGYNAIAPHLFSRWLPGDENELRTKAFQTWGPPDPQVMGDIAASATYLKELPNSNGKAGCIGFCSGGRHTYLVACQLPGIDAAVDCWGGSVIVDDPKLLTAKRPIAPIDLTEKMTAPLLGLFGNDDENPNRDQVNRTEAKLKQLGKTYEFHRYDGAGHAFFNYARGPAYRAEAAADGWKKVFAFYNKYLAG